MEKRAFGKTGMQVSVLGFGGAEIGFEGAGQETVNELLAGALDAGLNVIDTAECYPGSEELIGKAVSRRRRDFYLFTKCGHPEGLPKEDWSFDSILASIERSLKRLRTEYVDLVHLHSCSEAELRKGEVIRALETARQRGWTRFIGYSGDGAAARYAVECGRFDSLQTSISIADQEALDLTLPLARSNGLGVIAKRPIANVAWRYQEKPENGYHVPYWERLRKLNYDFTSKPEAVAIALRFTVSQPGVHTAIVGTKNPTRWRDNARLLEAGPLPDTEIRKIRERWKATAQPDWTGQV